MAEQQHEGLARSAGQAEAAQPRGRGRLPTTGRHSTRAALCASVWEDYLPPSTKKIALIARMNGVSTQVVHAILNSGEGRVAPADPAPSGRPRCARCGKLAKRQTQIITCDKTAAGKPDTNLQVIKIFSVTQGGRLMVEVWDGSYALPHAPFCSARCGFEYGREAHQAGYRPAPAGEEA